MTVDGVIFDFDGTLTRPGGIDFTRIRREIDCPDHADILAHVAALSPAGQQYANATIDRLEMGFAKLSMPNVHAETVVRRLRAAGLPLGILTRNSGAAVVRTFANFRRCTPGDFAAIVSREADCAPKPAPDGVFLAAQRMGIDPARALVVGDYRYDVEAGQSAGARGVLLTNGREPMRCAVTPSYVIDRLIELLDIIADCQAGVGS